MKLEAHKMEEKRWTHQKEHHPHSEAWWGQYPTVGTFVMYMFEENLFHYSRELKIIQRFVFAQDFYVLWNDLILTEYHFSSSFLCSKKKQKQKNFLWEKSLRKWKLLPKKRTFTKDSASTNFFWCNV